MNVIFSRKGFDSSSGGSPSPLLPDQTLLSMPIPAVVGPSRYCDLKAPGGVSYAEILRQLGWNQRKHKRGWRNNAAICHCDPDLRAECMPRPAGWRPSFGQIGVGQVQLTPFNIDTGDLFLFFGLFRQTELVQNKVQFIREARPFHGLFAWLRVGEIITLENSAKLNDALTRHPWLATHPHVTDQVHWRSKVCRNGANTLYLSAEGPMGAGLFKHSDATRLTAEGQRVSLWRTFPWLGRHRNRKFSRCADPARLQHSNGLLDTHAGRWQELVVNSANYPEVSAWADELTQAHTLS